MPNKLSQFWQELKRRRVHRLMAIYAGSAYIIFEASTLIFPRWGLPDWTIDLVLYLLILGAIVTFVMGWIYDLTPDGIQKTGPVSDTKTKVASPTPNGWKIASYISLVVIIVLLVLNILPRTGKNEILDKSIAVLPFINESPVSENEYLINGYRTEVHNNLCQIKDLFVFSLQSTEKFNNESISIPEMAMELSVGYLLSARGQIINENMRLVVQLVNANDEMIWSKKYNLHIESVEDHINIQSNIARLVAGEIKVIISPEEDNRMRTIPTPSLTAYDFYLRGNEESAKNRGKLFLTGYVIDKENMAALERAEEMYQKALELDSAYAEAYAGLAWVFYEKQFWGNYLSESFLDSVLIFADSALSYDNELSEAYSIKGQYYRQVGNKEQSVRQFEKAIRFNPNDWMAYFYIGSLYSVYADFQKSIEYLNEALSRHRGENLPDLLFSLGMAYMYGGFADQARQYLGKAVTLNGDSAYYYSALALLEFSNENFEKSAEYFNKSIRIDTIELIGHFPHLTYAGKDEEAYSFSSGLAKQFERSGVLPLQFAHRIGYAYHKVGKDEEAKYYFNEQIKLGLESIELGRSFASYRAAHYDLAGVYAFYGDKEKAYQYLDEVDKREGFQLWWVVLAKYDPLFESIRGEERFQRIIQNMEAKYKAGHESVRQWLEENNML